jgi:hypothetical protein
VRARTLCERGSNINLLSFVQERLKCDPMYYVLCMCKCSCTCARVYACVKCLVYVQMCVCECVRACVQVCERAGACIVSMCLLRGARGQESNDIDPKRSSIASSGTLVGINS